MRELANHRGEKTVFEQCRFGLVSKITGMPMRKKTAILTNCPAAHRAFDNKMCHCPCEHQEVQGTEGGEKRAAFAAKYPPEMVQALAEAVAENADENL
eukprot:6436412-Pyramimonas_sp.AAC.1